MGAKENKFLTLGPHAVMTPIIEPVIVALEPIFAAKGLHAVITSGLRVAEDQLRIIRDFLHSQGLDGKYLEAMSGPVTDKFIWQGKEVFKWQPGWSALLNSGTIINPPIGCICLMDYVSPTTHENKKGKFIDCSPHFKGVSFDIAGAGNGIADELAIIKDCLGKVPGLVGCLPERNNNCVHCDCKTV